MLIAKHRAVAKVFARGRSLTNVFQIRLLLAIAMVTQVMRMICMMRMMRKRRRRTPPGGGGVFDDANVNVMKGSNFKVFNVASVFQDLPLSVQLRKGCPIHTLISMYFL